MKFLINLFFRKPENKRVLFICNMQKAPDYSYNREFSGLYNSARMISDMLGEQKHIVSKIVKVIDSNSIDREVYKFKPDIVFIEALWVPAYKFHQLIKLHPRVKWVVRIHSEIPFLANEGSAISLINEYLNIPNVSIACNSPRAQFDLRLPGPHLPNYYKVTREHWNMEDNLRSINIGCFGSIRPMKNQLLQAMTAIRFADLNDLKLRFHMNTSRTEQGGDRVLKNLRALFKDSDHKLIEHPWMEPTKFRNLLKRMDMGLQVSLSETFNIVTADMVNEGVPVVTSKEISWVSPECQADPNSGIDIYKTMLHVFCNKYRLTLINLGKLIRNSRRAKRIWLRYIDHSCI